MVAFLLTGEVLDKQQLDYLVHAGLLSDHFETSNGHIEVDQIENILRLARQVAKEPLFATAVVMPITIYFSPHTVFDQQFIDHLRDALVPDSTVEGGMILVEDYIPVFHQSQKAKIESVLQSIGTEGPYSNTDEYIAALEKSINMNTGTADMTQADDQYILSREGRPVRVSELANEHTKRFLTQLVAKDISWETHAMHFTMCRTREGTTLNVCTWGECSQGIFHVRSSMKRAEVVNVMLLKTRQTV
jgi:hypothetical protein